MKIGLQAILLSAFNNLNRNYNPFFYTKRIFINRILVCQLWELRIFRGMEAPALSHAWTSRMIIAGVIGTYGVIYFMETMSVIAAFIMSLG